MCVVTVITRFLFRRVGKVGPMSDVNPDASVDLDEDALPEEYPPEQPYGVNERLTAAEEAVGESLEDRVKRERPDNLGQDEGRVGRLVAPGGEGTGDYEGDEVAEEIAPQARRDQLDPGDLGFGDSTLRDVTQEK